MESRASWSRLSTILGIVSCLTLVVAFLVPWYGANYEYWTGIGWHVEFSIGTEQISPSGASRLEAGDRGDVLALMTSLTFIITVSLAFAIAAAASSYFGKRRLGITASICGTLLLITSGVTFYFGIQHALSIHSFSDQELLNRSYTIDPGPMLGWWVVLTSLAIQIVNVIVLLLPGLGKRP